MSRARPIAGHWFDIQKNGQKATVEQLELLATVEGTDFDDFLERQPLTQGDVVKRLRENLGQTIPEEVFLRRQKWREERQHEKACRLCGTEGDSTRHHFVNRWMLLRLKDYQRKWADRRDNCIPVCLRCHRNLHSRNGVAHSIVPHLNDQERAFAQKALIALKEEQPGLFIWIAEGTDRVYETRLVRDYLEGKFNVPEEE
jgi:cytochrome c553